MATPLTVHVINATGGDVERLDLNGSGVEDWFGAASSGEIALRIVQHGPDEVAALDEADAPELQRILARFVSDPPADKFATEVGIVLCGTWFKGGLYGLMFDFDGWDARLGAQFYSGSVARQGCAVFKGAFANEPADHFVITAIHELGHVFNLQHDLTDRSFMALNGWAQGFNAGDRHRLALAGAGQYPEAYNHLPGGAPFADTVGGGAAKFGVGRQGRLRLSARVAKNRFLLGEPVVLDLTLHGSGRGVPVRPHLDPGFETMRVWYETPLGETLLYRPAVHLCPVHRGTVTVGEDNALRNNPRVHLGATGLVFDRPGEYRLWVEQEVGSRRRPKVVRSRRIRFEVVCPRGKKEDRIMRALTDPLAARFVAQRGGPLDDGRREELQELTQVAPEHDAVGHVGYALAADAAARGEWRNAERYADGIEMDQESVWAGVKRLKERIARQGR